MSAVRMPVLVGLAVLGIACWGVPRVAAADVVSEHPEWFVFTAPPQGTLTPVSGFEPPEALLIRLMPAVTAYGELLELLAGDVPLTLLYAGDTERAQAESAALEHGVEPAELLWWETGGLNSYAVGDFGFSAVRQGDGYLLVDAKYDVGKPLDDAFPSKWALEQAGSCAFRPPLVLQRGLLETNGAGICLVSTKVISMNPDLNQAQIGVVFHRYYGCTQVVWMQPLQGDGKGRLDTVFRFASPDVLLAGLYEVTQDSGNRLVMLENHKKLAQELPASISVTTLPMPTPRPAEGEAAWPSYLNWVVTPGYLLVPVFPTEDLADPDAEAARQEQALELLASLFPAPRTLHTISAFTLLAVGLRLNGLLLPVPAGQPLPCSAPESICSGNTMATCDSCFDQCPQVGLACASPTAVEICEVGAETSCLVTDVRECDATWTCEAGACKAPPSLCDNMPESGQCSENGDAVYRCVGSSLISEPCDSLETCIYDDATSQPKCSPLCPDACPTQGEGQCVSDAGPVRTCTLMSSGCLQWSQQECPSGLCANGECLGASDVVEALPEVVDNPEPQEVGDQNMNGGFRPKEGCAAGTQGTPFAALGMLLLLLGLRFICRRRPA